MSETVTPGKQVEQFRATFDRILGEVAKVIVAQRDVVESVIVALLAGGHVLVEGVPGLGKTKLVRSLAEALDLRFSRVQFTPDLMPADIIGTEILREGPGGSREFQFEPGPVFANVVLADEINRATPKTQSALLEAMQETSVTTGGQTRRLEPPFFVIATQNPIEMEGTYPLPEAQLDRFLFKIRIRMPPAQEMVEILERTTAGAERRIEQVAGSREVLAMQSLARQVVASRAVLDYAARLVEATHPGARAPAPKAVELVRYGASPRGAMACVLAGKVRALIDGRFNLSFEDIRRSAHDALRHRLILNFEGELRRADADSVVDDVLAHVRPAEE